MSKNDLDRKHKGAHSELIACAWLLSQGYEVFRNISPHGMIDIVGFKNGIFEYFDVKTMNAWASNGSFKPSTEEQLKYNVKMLYVNSDGSCEIVLPIRKKSPEKRICDFCGQSFFARRAWSRFCNRVCTDRHKNQRDRENRVRVKVDEVSAA